jgi:putative membrane protein
MKKIILTLAGSLLLFLAQAQTISERDKKFILQAAEGGLLEVELGKIASQQGLSEKVKELGTMMLKDHSKANEELKTLAQKKKVDLPQKLSDKKQKEVEELKNKKGKDFDEAYAKFMVKDHAEDIKLFKEEAEKGEESDTKEWALQKIKTLEHHKMMAEDTAKAIKK